MKPRALIFAAFSCALACSDPGAEDGATKVSEAGARDASSGTAGPLRTFRFSPQPAHLQTAVDGATVLPSILASEAGGYPGGADSGMPDVELELIARASHELVPAEPTFEVIEQPGGNAEESDLRIGLRPESALADGWYTLRIAAPDDWQPSGPSPEGVEGPRRLGDRYESSFHVGSRPLLLAVAACASSQEGSFPKLRVTFSEPVSLPDPAGLQVIVDGSDASCTVYEPQDTKPSASLGLSCTPAITGDAKVRVRFGAGFVAPVSGLPLTDASGAREPSVELPPASAGTVCRTWRETGVLAD